MGHEGGHPIERNPFYVLDVAVESTRMEVERQGQKLLAMLELQLEAAQSYRSPLGRHERSPELVRGALAELRDPRKRLMHELWYVGDELIDSGAEDAKAPPAKAAWAQSLATHGWSAK